MRLPHDIQPRYVVAATAAVALVMIASGFVELRQSRDELYHLLGESALALAETIDRSGANNLLSTEAMESLLADRLLDNAMYIARLDSAGTLRSNHLARLAGEHHLYRVNIFDRHGNKVLSSHAASDSHARLPEKHSPAEILAPLLRGEVDRMILGLKEARVEEGQRFAVAVRRTQPSGGAIVVNLDAADLLQFRRTIGIGKLLKDLGNNSGIEYVAIQDTQGIIAGGGVRELSSINADAAVLQAIASDTTVMRVQPFEQTEVFEVVRPFTPEGVSIGVLRIGLSMDEVRNAETRMLRRTIIMSLVVLIIGVLAFVFLVAQQDYQEMERRYRSFRTYTGNILAQMRDGVVTIDPTGNATIVNARAAEVLGLRIEDLQGKPLASVGEIGAELMNEVLKNQDGTIEREVDLPGKTQRIVEITLSTIRGTDGSVESRSAVLRDVTESRKLEREAQRNSKLTAMGQLASAVAHEIRNPLNAIGMIAQRFSKEFVPRRGVREFLSLAAVMRDETARVNAIIHRFLTFARPPKLQKREINTKDWIEGMALLFESQAMEKGVAFAVAVDGSGNISIDPELTKQAVLNLLQNALDATSQGGRIQITLTHSPDAIQIGIRDTGIGIPAASMDKIFDLYFTTKSHGMGLGLSITQQIVAQHGGRIDVSSDEGRGTQFVVHIPR
jgi:two-component system, NtrC family, sensor histidine kinase HydH